MISPSVFLFPHVEESGPTKGRVEFRSSPTDRSPGSPFSRPDRGTAFERIAVDAGHAVWRQGLFPFSDTGDLARDNVRIPEHKVRASAVSVGVLGLPVALCAPRFTFAIHPQRLPAWPSNRRNQHALFATDHEP
jgi:hypothetical protein